jgi:hypothetical protein
MPPGSPEPTGAHGAQAEPAPGAPERERITGRSRAAGRRDSAGAREGWASSPALARGELLLVAAAGLLLAVITSWPLVLHLPSRIAPDLGDPVRTAWQIAWVGHAMLHDPLHLFDSNAFYPHPLSLAFSDSLLGYGPAAFFGSGTVATLVRYNLLFLWAWSLCFAGAYLLARELGLRKLGGAAAGVAFAYAPYRVTEAGHLHVISSGGIALALFLLLRGYRRSSRKLVLAGWLVSAWQVSLGFTLGLQFAYLLAVLALIALVCWWRGSLSPGEGWRAPGEARGPLIPRRLLAVTAIGVVVLGAVTVYEARPYLKVAADYPTAKRTIKEVETYSSGPAALLAASSENRVWGGVTSGARAKVHSKNEAVFFPGGVILALALVGLLGLGARRRARGRRAEARDEPDADAGRNPFSPRLRVGLLIGIVTCSVLAMGLGLTGAGYPYRLLFDYAPGWDGVRVPGRIFTLATLFYALLAAAGVQMLVARIRPWAARSRLPAVPALLGAVLVVAVLGEGAGHLGHPVVPQPARAEVGLPGPLIDLPTDGALDRVWQYFSTDGFPKIANGESTFDIPAEDDLRGGMNGFPDRASVEKLRYYGIRTVVLHTVMPKGLPPEQGWVIAEPPNPTAAADKPIAGLGVTRRRVGSVVIYEIGPGPKALHGTD